MSSLSEQDHLNPNDPAYYAPRWLREKPEARPSSSHDGRSDPIRPPAFSPVSLDTQLENAVSNALWHPLDPEIIHEPPGFEREMDRRAALITVAGRFAAAVGVSAIVALFFVIMVPASRQADSASSTAGFLRSLKTALLPPAQQKDEAPTPAIAEFQPILASAQTIQPATREQSEQLLQQFLQWRQKPDAAEARQ
jgi:hypothetical protein